MKKDKKRVNGIVLETFSNGIFSIKLDNEKIIRAYLAGKMKINHIRLLIGDRVVVETTPYDPEKGRIVYRK